MSDFNAALTDREAISGTSEAPEPDSVEAQAPPFPKNVLPNGQDGKVCRSCQAVNPIEADACWKCGKFVVGTQAARTIGIYARHQPTDLLMSADELEAGIVADLGGIENLSTLERSYIRKIRDLEIITRLLTSDIARNSLFTPGCRVRASYDKFLNGLVLFDRYSQRLGLKRRARRVMDGVEYFKQL